MVRQEHLRNFPALAARLALRSAVLVTAGLADEDFAEEDLDLAGFAFAGVLAVLGVLAGRGLGLRSGRLDVFLSRRPDRP